MGAKELKMLDEGIDDNKYISIVLSENCEIIKNVVNIPRNEALSLASNILLQLELGDMKYDPKKMENHING